jgi:hypothetical protein
VSRFDPVRPRLEPLARFRVVLSNPQEIGQTNHGRRRVIGVDGGTFDGPRLSGEVLPGGADWQLVYHDGSASIDTRYTLHTYDGALLYLATRGVRHGSPEVLARLADGENVAPDEYYFRMSCRFETGDPRYAWLTRSVVVGSGLRAPGAVVYDAFAVT